MAARKKTQHCSECGAELKLGPARCPLCGTEPETPAWAPPPETPDPDAYQSNVRDLREQLRKLRDEGAEAV